MNKLLIESTKNYLNSGIPDNPEDITLQKVIIINRMILRFQMEIYDEIIDFYKRNLDIVGMLAQKLEIMGGQLSFLERKFKKDNIIEGITI